MAAPTPSQTVGPYLAIGLPWELGPVADADGVRISGLVLDGEGAVIPDAMVEAWCPEPKAFARSCTTDDGEWSVTMPRAPHYALHVFARGLLHHLSTRVYLADDPDDAVLASVPGDRRATLLARPSSDDDGSYRFDIRLQGDGETVFFDV
jgi:protocatechuate 3,4-dioxygenase, alpha subunit